jgi:hypothetical protein
MDEFVMTSQQLEERTAPDPASVVAIVAMAKRVRSGSKRKRRYAIPIQGGVNFRRRLDGSISRTAH